MRAGDTLLMPAGEKHVTRNSGKDPLVLLCFFPVPDISIATREPGVGRGVPQKP
jgi:oxalate decarboxylase/phosphoglucose isomerase-like protein (cupin superfamily)